MTAFPPTVPWTVLPRVSLNSWGPSLLDGASSGTYHKACVHTCSFWQVPIFHLQAGQRPDLCPCLLKKPQKAGRVLEAVALAKCCIVASWSGNLPRQVRILVVGPSQTEGWVWHLHHPRNNLAIRTRSLPHECPWKQGCSATRNARTTGLKGWPEKGDPGSILEIWALSSKMGTVTALFQCPQLFLS